MLSEQEKLQIKINKLIYSNITEQPLVGYEFKIRKEVYKGYFIWENGVVIDLFGGDQIADTGDYNDWFVYGHINNGYKNEKINLTDDLDNEERLIILGKPITIDLILLALEKEKNLDSCRLRFTNVNKFVYIINEDSENIEWKPDIELKYQNIETQEKLLKLFEI